MLPCRRYGAASFSTIRRTDSASPARSDGSVNVQIVMEQLGGGGHQTVAGAQFGTDGNIEDITKAVVANVRKQTEEEKE